MRKTILKKTPTVVKANALIQGRGHLTIQESRLVLLALSKLHSKNPLPKEKITFSVSEYMSIFGGSAGEIHTQLDFATTALMKRVVKIETEKGWDKFQWVSHSRLIRGSSIIEIQFHEMMAPYISEMKKCFTKIELPQLAGFTSSHALRIYENMLKWDTETCLEITVEDLKKMLGLYDEKKKTFDYPRFFDFEKKVLKQAESQIKLYTPHVLKYQKIGKRGPSGIRFIKFFLEFKNKSNSKANYEKINSTITQINGEVSEQPSLFASDSTFF